jgi:pyruvate/2-oxoglutarate dehydrogenase complex dihydrolipoamide acyltransferase (E2) component
VEKPFYELICLYSEPREFVDADEVIARIETDKVTVDIQAPVAGVIQEYFAGEGDTVEVGADFYIIDPDATGGSARAAPKAAEPATPAAEAPKVSINPFNTNFINFGWAFNSFENIFI